MQRLVLQSVLAAASALFILSATACDKGAEKKTDNKVEKTDDKAGDKTDVAAAEAGEPEPAGTTTTTTTGAVEPPAETDGGEPAGETGGETGGAVAPPDGDSGKEPDAKTDSTKTDSTKTDPKPDTKPDETAKIDAKALFDGKCKSCHGADGKGDTTIGKKVNIPSLAGTKLSKADAVKKIADGVPDTKMKGYKDKLSKDEIDALAAYVKKL
jgi:mono/diheme cytochrome c family protein